MAASTKKQIEGKNIQISLLKSSLEMSEESSARMLERVTLLEQSRQEQLQAKLVHNAVVEQFQSQLSSKDHQITLLRKKAQESVKESVRADLNAAGAKQVLTPIKRMMESKQAEVNSLQSKLSGVLENAKSHNESQLTAASKRIKTLCTEARQRDGEMTDKCGELLVLQQRLNSSDQARSDTAQQLQRVAAQERASFDRILQLQKQNELLKESIRYLSTSSKSVSVR